MKTPLLVWSVLAVGATTASATRRDHANALPPVVFTAENPDLDIIHHDFDLTISPETRSVSGKVTITATALANGVDEMQVDIADNLEVLAVAVDGLDVGVVRQPGRLVVELPEALGEGDQVDVAVIYAGLPEHIDGWGGTGLTFNVTETGEPWIYSLDEPYGAHLWVPVVEDVSDKSTWSLHATVPSGLIVASNGVQTAEPADNGDGTTTFHWSTNYANSIYLFSINVGPFLYAEDTYTRLDNEVMPVVLYALPEHWDEAVAYFAPTTSMIEFMAERFGEYPFADEKYGHVAVGYSGMEHVTLTSLSPMYFDQVGSITVLHELAHQWFGNLVTMNDWEHIWLNEGWATYCEALWREYLDPSSIDGYNGWRAWDAGWTGTVIAEDPSEPFDDTTAIYDKGAAVLHMLRRLVGDDIFFNATREYLSRFGRGNATTADLQAIFATEYGQDLDWFFEQWIYAPSSPQLVTWYQEYSDGGSPRIKLYIKQVQTHRLYRFLLDIILESTGGDQLFAQQWIAGDADLTILDLPAPAAVTGVIFDPDKVLLAGFENLGRSQLEDIPVIDTAISRYSGVGPIDIEVTLTADRPLTDYSVTWRIEGKDMSGESVAVTLAPDDYYESYGTGIFIWAQLFSETTGTLIWYPIPGIVRVYNAEHEYVIAALEGDINVDGVTNGVDLAYAATHVGRPGYLGPFAGDMDNDGDVDDIDLEAIAARMGAASSLTAKSSSIHLRRTANLHPWTCSRPAR